MSSIGFSDVPDWDGMREDAEKELELQAEIERPLREAGLPVPDPTRRRREIAPERLDVVALWRGLSDEEREAIGVLGLGLLVSGVSNGIGTGPLIGVQSGPLVARGATPLLSPAKRVRVAQPG